MILLFSLSGKKVRQLILRWDDNLDRKNESNKGEDMTDTYVARQMVTAQYEARYYGLAFPGGISPHIADSTKWHLGSGSTPEMAKTNLQRVIQGYCEGKTCTPIGEAEVDLSLGTKILHWLSEVWASI
ncbi:MAG: hypothetical protein Q8P84_05250 [Deltaproteobacteria bacterium]|nr:hypothetical protein [Deltaproteobacteria bacterium]